MGLASKLAAAQQQAGAFPGQAPSSTGYGQPQGQAYGAHAPASSPYGAPQQQQQQQQYGQQQNQYAPPSAPPPVPGGRPGQQLPYPGAPQQQGQGYGGQPQAQGYGTEKQQYGQGGYGGNGQGYGAPPPPYGGPPQQGGYPQQQQPQGQFGAPGAGGAATNPQTILQVLADCVRDQGISAFYPPGSLEPLAQRIAQSGALARIASEWRLPMEVAIDLAKLALFDTVLYIDDSGSMAFEENGSRIDDAKLVVGRVAQAASLFDTDGIQVFFMNNRTVGNGITSEAQANQLIGQIRFSGLTPLGTALDQKILQPILLGPARSGTLKKPLLIIAVTDGAPGGEDRNTLTRVITTASRTLAGTRYGKDALSVQLAQIGNDMGARAFLEEVDNHPEVGSLVDTTSNYEQEADDFMKTSGQELTPELWLIKLLLGPIDSSYDTKDERR